MFLEIATRGRSKLEKVEDKKSKNLISNSLGFIDSLRFSQATNSFKIPKL